MARKWHKHAIEQRERRVTQKSCSVLTKAEKKGHFVIYSTDKMRFVLPLVYLENNIFKQLFKLAEEEFGVCTNMPLTLPFDAKVIKYLITLVQGNAAKDLDEAVLVSLTSSTQCQAYLDIHQQQINQHLLCNLGVKIG